MLVSIAAWNASPELAAILEMAVEMMSDPHFLLLVLLLGIAVFCDTRAYRIPNWLTFGGAALGLAVSAYTGSYQGAAVALAGLATGLAVMLPFYLLKTMGAGDVKLVAAVGAYLGPTSTLYAVLYTFIAGGIAALLFALYRGAVPRLLANLRNAAIGGVLGGTEGLRVHAAALPGQSAGRLPYALCIAVGSLGYLINRQFGLF